MGPVISGRRWQLLFAFVTLAILIPCGATPTLESPDEETAGSFDAMEAVYQRFRISNQRKKRRELQTGRRQKEERRVTIRSVSRRADESPPPEAAHRIYNGEHAEANEYQYFAEMFDLGKSAGCSGSLIAQRWILTAEHCLSDNEVKRGFHGWRVGWFCPEKDNCDSKFQFVETDYFVRHPENDEAFAWDIAVVRLKESVVDIEPVLLNDGSYFDFQVGMVMTTMGAGAINDDDGDSQFLATYPATFVEMNVCIETYSRQYFADSIVCMASDRGGPCFGDSGGPVVVEGAGEGGRDVLVGPFNFGPGRTCEIGSSPEGAADVTLAYQWILDSICPSEMDEDVPPEFCEGYIAPPTAPPSTAFPSPKPSEEPSSKPSSVPTRVPSSEPSSVPTSVPSSGPSSVPTRVPSSGPSSVPTRVPSSGPSSVPTKVSSSEPTSEPTNEPSLQTSSEPPSETDPEPTPDTSQDPSGETTSDPTSESSFAPTNDPTVPVPTSEPNPIPTALPTIEPPTAAPTISAEPSVHIETRIRSVTSFPWFAQMRVNSKGDGSGKNGGCAGTLIGQEWIVTAASCIKRKQVRKGTHGWRFGAPCPLCDNKDNTVYHNRATKRFWNHPKLSLRQKTWDIALVKIDLPMILANPVSIWQPGLYDFDEGDSVVGLGYDYFKPKNLEEVSTEYLPGRECADKWNADYLADNTFCVVGETRGLCQQRGSPILKMGGAPEGAPLLLGFRHYGPVNCDLWNVLPDLAISFEATYDWIRFIACRHGTPGVPPPDFCEGFDPDTDCFESKKDAYYDEVLGQNVKCRQIKKKPDLKEGVCFESGMGLTECPRSCGACSV